jgi:hypothetical protein
VTDTFERPTCSTKGCGKPAVDFITLRGVMVKLGQHVKDGKLNVAKLWLCAECWDKMEAARLADELRTHE